MDIIIDPMQVVAADYLIRKQTEEIESLRQRVKKLEQTCVHHAEIETALSDQLAACQARIEELERNLQVYGMRASDRQKELLDCLAREAKLRDVLSEIVDYLWDGGPIISEVDERVRNALILPQDDTALQEALKQAKREALLEAAERVGGFTSPYVVDDVVYARNILRHMAERENR